MDTLVIAMRDASAAIMEARHCYPRPYHVAAPPKSALRRLLIIGAGAADTDPVWKGTCYSTTITRTGEWTIEMLGGT